MKDQRPVADGAARKSLAPVIHALFSGATLCFSDGGDRRRLLCFRGAGELLPQLPHAASDQDHQAISPGLFASYDAYGSGQGPGSTPVDQKWLCTGSLDEIEITLESLGAPATVVTQLAMHVGLRKTRVGDIFEHPIEIHPDHPKQETTLERVAPRG